MQYKVSIGSRYTVTAATESCVVTDAAGRVVATVKPGAQYTFTASTATVELSDASAALTATFNSAPAAGGAGGVSEGDLVNLGVLTAGEAPVEKASTPVCLPAEESTLIGAKGFRFRTPSPTGCNGIAIVVGEGVKDSYLLGCQMELKCEMRGVLLLISEPLVSVQNIAAGRRCLFYFAETIPPANIYHIRIYQNGENVLMTFSCGVNPGMYYGLNWLESVGSPSGYYPALAWEVLKKETVYSPAVDSVPTEDSARPVSSGGVFSALAELGGGEQTSTTFVLENIGEMYLGDAWWSPEMTMADGLGVSLLRLPEDGGESEYRGLLTLSAPRTAWQLLEALSSHTGAPSGQFFVYPVTIN